MNTYWKVDNIESLKNWRTYIYILVDIVLINISYKAAFYFRFVYNIPPQDLANYKNSAIAIVLIHLACFYFFKMYDRLWNYASVDEFVLAVGGCVTAGIGSITFGELAGLKLPFGVSFLAGIFSLILVVGFRMSFRIYTRSLSFFDRVEQKKVPKVLVVGAGATGILLIKEMQNHKEAGYQPVALIDDDKNKIGTTISGIKVYGNRHQIGVVAKSKGIDTIVIAIPSIDDENMKELLDLCKSTGCRIKIMPRIYDILDNKVSLSDIRDIDVEDLLGRDPVKLDMEGISDYIKNGTVLVTGGGGSIGSELCRQIARFEPRQLIVLDIYENNAYDLQNELKYKYPSLNLKVVIASVRDKKRLDNIFSELKPGIVFHAAAHKHVPLMEDNPGEAIKNNIFGTLNLAECADKYNVKKFVMISTDKAVNPTNVMGATKRVCEMIIQAMDKASVTNFVAVRFGNVLGSNGSVIPLFKRQIANGGPVTVTHKNITRFFMTIPEAAQLVLQAGAFAKGGEIFILDMGKAVKIYDLACDLIRLSGLEPNKDIKIEITGLRPGEKLYEELLMGEEGLRKTGHDKIFVGRPIVGDMAELCTELEKLKIASEIENTYEMLREIKDLVPTYKGTALEEVAMSQ